MAELVIIEILTPNNYHSWKLKMQQLLQSKGLWQTLVENQPTFTKEMEKFVYRNKLDEAMGLIRLHVSDNLLFHLDGCDMPKKSWDKLASLFSKVNKFRALQLETELSSLILDEHASIEDYLAKLISLVMQLKGCRNTKSDGECIFMILSKLKGPYQVFFSSFYSTMDALSDQFNFPSFEVFFEHLIREQSKFQQLDSLSSSQALISHSSKGKGHSHPQKEKVSDKGGEPPSKAQHKSKSSPQTNRFERSSSRIKKRDQMNLAAFVGKKGIQNPGVTRKFQH